MSATIEIAGVSKVYDGDVRAVDAIAMEIRQGEFFSLLGPSGCGKTTTLRMIAGFDTPSMGAIRVDGADITHVPAHKRDMAMVFQNYALFPHRTVAENVAFGLRMRGFEKDTIARKVKAALAMVELSGMEDRRPSQLSGRPAAARGACPRHRDRAARPALRRAARRARQEAAPADAVRAQAVAKEPRLTLVFVTHDQEEALAMSDRIAVMNRGRVEQVGTPIEIYDQPVTRFVADFIGDTNIFRGERVATATGPALAVGNGLTLMLPNSVQSGAGVLSVALRPEKIGLSPDGDTGCATAEACAQGVIDSTNFLGGAVLYRIALSSGHHVLAQQPNAGGGRLFAPGNTVTLDWKPSDLVVLKD